MLTIKNFCVVAVSFKGITFSHTPIPAYAYGPVFVLTDVLSRCNNCLTKLALIGLGEICRRVLSGRADMEAPDKVQRLWRGDSRGGS